MNGEYNHPMTEAEELVLCEIARGHSNRQIAKTLNIAVGTVKNHCNAIFVKLGVENRTQAALKFHHIKYD
jgi:DNA-binding NarL/FixJ family response regulator